MTYEELVEKIRKEALKADVSGIGGRLAYQINIEGEAEGKFYIEVKDGEVHVEPYEYYDRDALIITSADTILKIMSGKQDPILAFTLGKIKVEGDLGKAAMIKEIVGKKKK